MIALNYTQKFMKSFRMTNEDLTFQRKGKWRVSPKKLPSHLQGQKHVIWVGFGRADGIRKA